MTIFLDMVGFLGGWMRSQKCDFKSAFTSCLSLSSLKLYIFMQIKKERP